MEYSEVAELENKIAILKDEITAYRNSMPDGVERRKTLAKMQIELGKHTRRLRTLNGLS
jgi:hypothetical protein